MITAETKNILVEAAWFDPATVRRSSKRHGLHTDASHRFERGADFNAPPVASALVSQLILEAGGHVDGEMIDVAFQRAAARTARRPAIGLSHREVRRILGATEDGRGVEQDTTESVLQALGCGLAQGRGRRLPGDSAQLAPGSRTRDRLDRRDRPRLWLQPLRQYASRLLRHGERTTRTPAKKRWFAKRCSALGWNEALSSTFCSATEAVTFAPQPGLAVAMGNPLNEEAGMLRPSLLPGMLTMLAHNLNRNVSDVQLFENGTVFSGSPERVDERPALSLGASGCGVERARARPRTPLTFMTSRERSKK